jgi:ribose 5-phosphate isomerase RpiB
MSEGEIRNILEIWFKEPFGGGRHQRRIDKLDQ